MGWQDRDYAREEAYRSARSGRGLGAGLRVMRLTTQLIIINVAIFVLEAITRSDSADWIFETGVLYTPYVLDGQVWRLITAQYLHADPMHLFFNMLGLYFLGPYLEQLWGKWRFFGFYTACGLAGNLFLVLLQTVGFLPAGPALGASGCILGILGACAVLFPGITLILMFFPMRIRTAALLFVGLYTLNLLSKGFNAGGDAAHLAGLAAGAGYAYWKRGGFVPDPRVFGRSRTVSARTRRPDNPRPDPNLQRRVDAILDKIKTSGMNSLTAQERELLSRASRQERERGKAHDARFGRLDKL